MYHRYLVHIATFQQRGDKWRAIVRRKGFAPKSRTFPTKSAAPTWADRIERELADKEARGAAEHDGATVAELVDWYSTYVGQLKRISLTQRGNLSRVKEGLGDKVASKLTAADVIEHTRKRRQGEHINKVGHRVPGCSGATMNVELGYLSEMLKVSKAMGKLTLPHDPVAEARPSLRLVKLVAKSVKRNRRPTAEELSKLRGHFDTNAWWMKLPMSDIVDFAIGTAKREGEITRLLWEDLDPTTRTALLRDAKHPREKKGNHKRFPLLGAMWELVDRQPTKARQRIFPYKPDSVGTAFRRACVALGIRDLHFHDLRHEATSRLFEQGLVKQQAIAYARRYSGTLLVIDRALETSAASPQWLRAGTSFATPVSRSARATLRGLADTQVTLPRTSQTTVGNHFYLPRSSRTRLGLPA